MGGNTSTNTNTNHGTGLPAPYNNMTLRTKRRIPPPPRQDPPKTPRAEEARAKQALNPFTQG